MVNQGDEEHENVKIPFLMALFTYISFIVLFLVGHIRDFFLYILRIQNNDFLDISSPGFIPLFSDFESFYIRHAYRRVHECWNTSIIGPSDIYINVEEHVNDRETLTVRKTGNIIRCLNTGSYNYLGFGEASPHCIPSVLETLNESSQLIPSSVLEFGQSIVLSELEKELAFFLKKEESICFGMGFATNAYTIHTLVDKETAIISDQLNHSSLALGAKLSGGKVYVFSHNDMESLEAKIKEAIIIGQPITRRPWKKIIILVEGVYSMEGNFANLPKIVELKKKYKCYLYLDEAHSIGAVGKNGGGVVEYFNLNTNDIDIMMEKKKKSFGAAGGYIAGSKELIDHIRYNSFCSIYGTALSPVVCSQILSALKVITGKDGSNEGKKRLDQLHNNCYYLRLQLENHGFIIFGNKDTPIVPILLCVPAILQLFYTFMISKGIAVVVVSFPATPILSGRARLCISSNHTKENMDFIIECLLEFSKKYKLLNFHNSKF